MALSLPLQVVRRSGRIPKEIPIVLIGSDLAGKIFSEQTKTVILSLHGAGLVSRHKLSPEQEMVLRWPERNKEAEIRIVGQIGGDSGLYTYGVAFFDHVVNFWEMEFPPPSPHEREFGVLSLACNVCQTIERIDDHSIEADVCATNEGILRFCIRCGCSTVWKLAQPGATPLVEQQPMAASPPPRPNPAPARTYAPAQQSDPTGAGAYSAAPPADFVAGGLPAAASPGSFTSPFRPAQPYRPAPGSSHSPTTSVLTLPATEKHAGKSPPPTEERAAPPSKFGGVNRRKYPRIKVNYIALVRHAERGEEFVQCEDVSRGGLRFKSTSRYIENTMIEVAAPYSSGQPAIFVAARIVYVQELREQNLFRYGAEYLNTKPRGAF